MSNEESRKGPNSGAQIDKITHTCKFCGADVMIAVQEYEEPQAPKTKARKDAPIDKVTHTCKFCGSDVMVAIQEYQEP